MAVNYISSSINSVEDDKAKKVIDQVGSSIAHAFLETLKTNTAINQYSNTKKITKPQEQMRIAFETEAKQKLTEYIQQQIDGGGSFNMIYQTDDGKETEFNLDDYIRQQKKGLNNVSQFVERQKLYKQLDQNHDYEAIKKENEELKEKDKTVNKLGTLLAIQTPRYKTRSRNKNTRLRRGLAKGLKKYINENGEIPEEKKREATEHILKVLASRRGRIRSLVAKASLKFSTNRLTYIPGTKRNKNQLRDAGVKQFAPKELEAISELYQEVDNALKTDTSSEKIVLHFLKEQLKVIHQSIVDKHDQGIDDSKKNFDAFKQLESPKEKGEKKE